MSEICCLEPPTLIKSAWLLSVEPCPIKRDVKRRDVLPPGHSVCRRSSRFPYGMWVVHYRRQQERDSGVFGVESVDLLLPILLKM